LLHSVLQRFNKQYYIRSAICDEYQSFAAIIYLTNLIILCLKV